MAQKKKQLVSEGLLDKHGRPNDKTPKEYLRALPDVKPATPAEPAATVSRILLCKFTNVPGSAICAVWSENQD